MYKWNNKISSKVLCCLKTKWIEDVKNLKQYVDNDTKMQSKPSSDTYPTTNSSNKLNTIVIH